MTQIADTDCNIITTAILIYIYTHKRYVQYTTYDVSRGGSSFIIICDKTAVVPKPERVRWQITLFTVYHEADQTTFYIPPTVSAEASEDAYSSPVVCIWTWGYPLNSYMYKTAAFRNSALFNQNDNICVPKLNNWKMFCCWI